MIDIPFKKMPYRYKGDKPVFLSQVDEAMILKDSSSGLVVRLKSFARRYSWFYRFLFYVFNPAFFSGPFSTSLLSLVPQNSIVEIGAGDRRLAKRIINVDICAWPNVDVIASAADLPFADATVGGIIMDWVIEHVEYPEKAISEIERVLMPGGYAFFSTNFVFPYHAAPRDFHRWSKDGLLSLFSHFDIVSIDVSVGPTSALLAVFEEWLSITLSFGWQPLKECVWILSVLILFPFKFLDIFLSKLKTSESLAAGFSVIVRKKI